MNLLKNPNFIIIGSQKCGTTSLYHYLSQHPQVIMSPTKEIHYFDLNYGKGIEWYNKQFPSFLDKIIESIKIGKKVITGEASPYYIFHPHAIKRIYNYNKNIKLIILLRNPIDRAWSHYNHIKYNTKGGYSEELNFPEALREEDERLEGELEKMAKDENYISFNYQYYSYKKRGEYFWQIKNIYEYFPKKKILILKSEDFFERTQTIFDEVCKFLGVSQFSCRYAIKNKSSKGLTIDNDSRRTLKKYYKQHNKKLYNLIKRDFGW